MDILGQNCVICGARITMITDGTFCPQCRTVFHHQCLPQNPENCPSCGQTWIEPEALHIYYPECPYCGRRLGEKQKNCSCGATVFSENAAKHKEWILSLRRSGRLKGMGGIGMVLVAIIILVVGILFWKSQIAPGNGQTAAMGTGASDGLGGLSKAVHEYVHTSTMAVNAILSIPFGAIMYLLLWKGIVTIPDGIRLKRFAKRYRDLSPDYPLPTSTKREKARKVYPTR